MRLITNTFFVADDDCGKCPYKKLEYSCGTYCEIFDKAVNNTPLPICKQSTIRETESEEPTRCFVKLGRNEYYPIVKIHYNTKQVTVQERAYPNVYNTVSFNDVDFDLSNMNNAAIVRFLDKVSKK